MRQTISGPLFLILLLGVVSGGCRTVALKSYDYEDILWTADWGGPRNEIVTGGNSPDVRIYSPLGNAITSTIPTSNTVTGVAWHPGKERLAVTLQAGEEGSFLFDLRSGEKRYLDSISAAGARGLGWSPDGELLAVGDNDGYLLLYDYEGRLQRRRKVEPKGITALSWHPDGQIILTVGSGIARYELANDRYTHRPAREQEVLMLSVAWHPEGALYATGDYGQPDKKRPPYLQYWSADGKLIGRDSSSRVEIRNLAWSPTGNLLASASDGIRLWTPGGEQIRHGLRDRYLWGLAWKPDGTRLITTSGDGEAFIVDSRLRTVAGW
ncbi:WD40 repeat domain-containing protein [Lewinella sp. IMCC34183]|uniref:WD40 repeat domain-containing protein n=1 Tax=Lewinella sp. IMCC34183 TaxID=2248762 RepID=UPI000E232188|nr:WD40 repeat domain-containing protein [Lewinella sp. IMCC34183]